MLAFLARLVLAISLLFGSVVVPAMAEPGTAHAMEIIDVDCDVAATSADTDEESSGDAPPIHADHHHCSACAELNSRSRPSGMPVSGGLVFRGPATVLASRATAPPIQPPAA